MLHKLDGHYTEMLQDLRSDILAFYQDLTLPIATKADQNGCARLQEELIHLDAIDSDLAWANVTDSGAPGVK